VNQMQVAQHFGADPFHQGQAPIDNRKNEGPATLVIAVGLLGLWAGTMYVLYRRRVGSR